MPRAGWSADLWESASYDDQSYKRGCGEACGSREGAVAYDTAQKQGKSFIDLYDHTHIVEHVGEFLDHFVPRKVIAGNDFIPKTCPRVMRKPLKWMREKHLVELTNEDIQDMCENQLWEDTVRDMGL